MHKKKHLQSKIKSKAISKHTNWTEKWIINKWSKKKKWKNEKQQRNNEKYKL